MFDIISQSPNATVVTFSGTLRRMKREQITGIGIV
jgi:hypothetical protein